MRKTQGGMTPNLLGTEYVIVLRERGSIMEKLEENIRMHAGQTLQKALNPVTFSCVCLLERVLQ